VRFDMRAPSHGAPSSSRYAAALAMCERAEDRGCLAVVLCEHHGCRRRLPSAPLLFASSIAARTLRPVESREPGVDRNHER
jgi:alkanesulfonate monooxygenase SsuD/methylene tetrahydromethanopterin reductase-like flavin-dependent oxidoreductase (luciferase family)